MDGPGGYYIKWHKSDWERQIGIWVESKKQNELINEETKAESEV